MGNTNNEDMKNIQDIFALSPIQEGMLYHYLKNPGSSQYCSQLIIDISGDCNANYFQLAWNQVADINEMLRTTFRWKKIPKPVQVILRTNKVNVQYHDFSTLSTSMAVKQKDHLLKMDLENTFDLTEVPFRVILCKLKYMKYQVIISNHHILYDGWSNGILLQEFFSTYDALQKGVTQFNTTVKPSYKEYIKWLNHQARLSNGDFWQQHLAGWQQQSGSILKGQPIISISQSDSICISLPSKIRKHLEELGKKHKVTLAAFLYTSWGIILQRYNNCNDVILGTTVSGRNVNIKEIEKIVGLFINTIPLRVLSEPTDKFIDLVVNINRVLQDREIYEHIALVDILNHSNLEEKGEPFDSIMVIENYPLEQLLDSVDLPWKLESYTMREQTHYPLTISVKLHEIIKFNFIYQSSQIDNEFIQQIASHWVTLLEQIADNPEQLVVCFDFLNEKEKENLLIAFNQTSSPYAHNITIMQIFMNQVSKTPGAIAVRGEQPVSYLELDERTSYLAGVLRQKGVKVGDIIAIVQNRMLEDILGIFAILKAGAVYLPLLPDFPQQRRNYILADSGPRLILNCLQLPGFYDCGIDILSIDKYSQEIKEGVPPIIAETSINASCPAYVLYTSGSTGQPKGVVVRHQAVVNLLFAIHKEYPTNSEDAFLLKTPLVFDVSVSELFGWILGGACLALLELEGEKDPQKIIAAIKCNSVTHINFVPSMFAAFLSEWENFGRERLSCLKHIFLAGEVLPPGLVEDFVRIGFKTQLHNIYGPTENTVYATCFPLSKWEGGIIPIGKPLSNIQVYIVDYIYRLQPAGVPGELLLGGAGMAEGYLNRVQLTNETFIINPFLPGEKAYRTGDLTLWRRDGNIEFVGRIDQQVKIRGFRIELGDIENNLLTHHQIKGASVKVIDEGQNAFLCAYIVSNSELNIAALKEYLSDKMPLYMIPRFFIFMDRLPQTVSGKIDRNKLPKPNINIENQYIAPPLNEKEKKMVQIWAQLLQLDPDQIGIDHSYFELGGHSLKTIALSSRIHKEFNVEIPLTRIIELSTIRRLATYLYIADKSSFEALKSLEKRSFYPLSSAQLRLFAIQQRTPASTAYNMTAALEFSGKLNLAKLEKAIQSVILRHESLRTSFELHDDVPIQKIQETVDFAIEFIEIGNSESTVYNNEEIIDQFIRPFDLSSAPLFRACLIQFTKERYLLITDMHHIIADGVSFDILKNDLKAFYLNHQLPPLEIHYKEFTHWQNKYRNSEGMQKQAHYWLNIFQPDQEIPILNLPTDFKRPEERNFSGSSVEMAINEELTQKLRDIGTATGTTLYVVLLTAFHIMLSKLSSQEDIVIGSPVLGRTRQDIEPIIGMFVNTLALRNHSFNTLKIREFIALVNGNFLSALENQDYLFEDLVDKTIQSSNPGRNPLFDIMMIYRDSPDMEIVLPDLDITSFPFQASISKFDLTLTCIEKATGIEISLIYSRELFKEETVYNYLTCFKQVLSAVAFCPKETLSSIEIISGEEKKRILNCFNQTYNIYPDDKTLVDLFYHQAIRTPFKIAIRGDVSMTYQDVMEKSDQLVNVIQERGIANGVICIIEYRAPELFIGIMAILKAGCAYLPMLPTSPRERISYILQDSGSRLILTSMKFSSIRATGLEVVQIDDPASYSSSKTDVNKNPIRFNSSFPAYVLYTSGSTGQPKGVIISRRSVVNLLYALQKEFPVQTGDVYLLKTPLIFDVSVSELFGWIMGGGSLAILEQEGEKDPVKIIHAIKSEGVTHINFIPSMFGLFIDVWNRHGLGTQASLKYINLAGEVLLPKLVERFAQLNTGISLNNLYGPTENTVFATYFPLSYWESNGSVPIGKSLENVMVYIMDMHDRLQPIGVPGELCLSGDGMAKGYMNRIQLTHEKFTPNPFVLGERMYHTGDLARWRMDGIIEFIGRIDNQIKIRGFRIELGDIENNLIKHPDIKGAVVKMFGEGQDAFLCAYIAGNPELKFVALKEYLSDKMPPYMIPRLFSFMDRLPQTASGKIDRKKLPKPDAISENKYIAPRNEIEKKLVRIWGQLLQLEPGRIGIDDSFFHLGGHSIKSILLNGCIHKEFKIQLPLSEIFALSTIRKLAAHLRKTVKSFFESISPVEKRKVYPLSSVQKRLFAMQQRNPASKAYNMTTILELTGTFQVDLFKHNLKKIVSHHESLRTVFELLGDGPVQKIYDIAEINIEMFEFSKNTIALDQEEEIISAFVRPFDLLTPPMYRVGLIKFNETRYILMIDMHHIIADGASVDILINDLNCLYAGGELREMRIQYKDFALWQNKLENTEQQKEQARYWSTIFPPKVEIPVLNLPVDFNRSSGQDFAGGSVEMAISEELTRKLRDIGISADSTLYIVILAALNVMLSKLCGQEDIIIGSPVLGRTHRDIESVIGMFVNTLALRNWPHGSLRTDRFIALVKEHFLKALENQNYPYEYLLENISQQGVVYNQSLFKVMMVYQDEPVRRFAFPGVDIAALPYKDEISKFDLVLNCLEKDNRLHFKLSYSTAYFKKATANRFLDYFRRILNVFTGSSCKKLAQIEWIGGEEKERILHHFNSVYTTVSHTQTLHQLFQQQVSLHPDHIALVFKNSQLNYCRLNIRANRLAHHLRAKGVVSDTIVALMLGRSFAMIISMLAVLKAGGAYLPIDTDYPEKRKKYILTDSGCQLMLCDGATLSNFDLLGEFLEIIDPDTPIGLKKNDINPNPINRSEDLAYTIYTSGSTGNPKGVLVRHMNAVNVVTWFARKYQLGESIHVLQMSDYTFDPSVNQVFGSLLYGAQLHLISKGELLQVALLRQYIQERQIHVLHFVPLLLHELLTSGPKLESVKYVLSGGEALSDKVKNEIIALGYNLYNQYGPTETTVDALVEKCFIQKVSLGTPINNTRVYILDKDSNLSPIGISGEICIAGTGVTRGYLNDPTQTTAVFSASPFVLRERMYRTGDMGKWLLDGKIQFIGRKDYQVKIHGYRIELGEIENHLRRIDGISEAVAIARRKKDNQAFYLCAYILTNKSLKEKALKEQLAAELPEYMIPSYIIPLETFPVTPVGKINRNSLPEPEILTSFIPPHDRIEEELTGIWAKALGIEKESVSMDDNFFKLGGHSLKVVIVGQKIHKQFDVKIPMPELFKCLTIQSLAEYIRKSVKDKFYFIEPSKEQEYYPLSSAQKRIFILQQMETHNVNYNMPGVRVLEGKLNRKKLEMTINKLIQRHESLRTSFHLVDEEPMCKIHPPGTIGIEIDFDELREGQEEDEVLKDAIKPFQLSHPPLVRVHIIRTHPLRYLLVIDMHHIISDGTSFTLFMKDFMAFYRGENLKALRIQYKDFTQWQNRQIGTDSRIKQEGFWREQFSGDIPVLDLPTDFKRPIVRNYDGDIMEFEVKADDTYNLKTLAIKEDATLFMVLLALINILLSKLSGQQDVVIGTPVEGRSHEDLRHIIGMFVNTQPIRNFPYRELSFIQFLNQVKAHSLAAFENQDYPFEELVEKVMGNINRDASRNPLFDVMFGLQNMEMVTLAIPGLTLKSYPPLTLTSKFDLSFFAIEEENSLHFALEYGSRLFKAKSIQRFITYFQQLVVAVTVTPGITIGDIDILPVEEKHRILLEFNGANAEYPTHKTIAEMFVEQVAQFSTKIALKTPSTNQFLTDKEGGATLTYDQLNDNVNQLVVVLKQQNIPSGSPVALILDRSIQMVVSVLAVSKISGVFLPIEPTFPQKRIDYTLADSGTQWILTHSHYLEQVISRGKIINVDESSIYTNKPIEPHLNYSIEEPAYIIYTSGSTGKPKGVSVSHRSILNTLFTLSEAYPCTGSDSYLLKTPYIFDVSLSELLGWFIGGGGLVILEKEAHKNPAEILSAVIQYGVTHLNFVPSMFSAFLDYLRQYSISQMGQLKYIFLAGEALHSEMVSSFRTLNINICLENLYGPTEAAVYASGFSLQDRQEFESIPIGKPLKNTRLYILDYKHHLLPIGCVGELFISGAGLAQGYLNQPALTCQKFVPDCVVENKTGEKSNRMYKTGDLARWLPDGNIQFLGRTDHQVKIRGYRIELEEIENALLMHPEINEALVIARKDHEGCDYLCAYTVSGREMSHQEFQHFLAKTLPEYMIPVFFVSLEHFPLKANGKPDIIELPAPEIEIDEHSVVPRDEVEETLAQMWAQLLGIEKDLIGIDTSFFKLGGHSLKATILASRIHKTFHVQIPIMQVFRAPIIRELAAYIKRAEKEHFLAINPAEKREYYPLSSTQKRLYILQQLNPSSVAYNITSVLKITGHLDIKNLAATLKELVKRFDVLRTYFKQVSDEPVQALQPHASIHLEFDECSEDRIADRLTNFIRAFHLSCAPLFRVGVLKIQEDEYIFIVDTHHIIIDGTSMTLLVNHITSLYTGNSLPITHIQYLDFCLWQEHMLNSGSLETLKQYWQKQFAPPLPVLDMPTDFPRESVQSFKGERLYSQLDKEITQRLTGLMNQTDTTLFMLMLAVLNVLLSWYSHQEDIIVGTAIAGRYHADLENMVGLLMETLALRNKPSADKPFSQFLEEVKINTLAAYENHAYPFMEVLLDLGLENDFSRNPLFDVFLIMQNTERPNLKLDNITISEYPYESGSSKADIILVINETDGVIQLNLRYCSKLFKCETMETFLQHFITIVTQVLDQPAIQIKDIDIIGDKEKRYLLDSMQQKYNPEIQDFEFTQEEAVLEAEFNF